MLSHEAPSHSECLSKAGHAWVRLQAGKATGAFQAIPMVPSADEHLASALRRARRIMPSSKLKNEAAKARNKAARQMDGAPALHACPCP